MRLSRSSIAAAAIAAGILAGIPNASVADPVSEPLAQAQRETVPQKAKAWTRARMAAAKKRWAANKEKFAACTTELREEQTKRKISTYRQVLFLESCMKRKP